MVESTQQDGSNSKNSFELKTNTLQNDTCISFQNTDEVFEKRGEFNFGAKRSLILVAFFLFFFSWNDLAYLFYGLDSGWYCKNEATSQNSSCNFTTTVFTTDSKFDQRCILNRSDWTYEKTKYFSMVTEYDLICDKTKTAELMLYFAPCGRFLGIIPAILCDVFGRKRILFISSVMLILLNVTGYFVRNLIAMLLILILSVTFNIGVISSGYLIGTEIVGPKKRSFASNYLWILWTLSLCLLSAVGYGIQRWRTMRLVMSLPGILLLFSWKYIPESPRWLHATGKLESSAKVLSQLTNRNKSDKEIVLRKLVVTHTSLRSILLNRSLLKKHVYFVSINFFIALLFYGINLSTTFLSGNFYLDFALVTAVEIPGSLVTIYVCDRFGRKLSTTIPLWICCGLLAGISATPTSYAFVRSFLGIAAKFFVTISYNAEYLLVCESYATSVRSQALCIIDFGILLGNACAPWLVIGLKNIKPFAPFVLMTLVSAANAVLCQFMVETRGKPTLEVVS